MRIENSFIPVPGVGEKTERKLWRNGVTHWDHFDGSLVGTKQARNVSNYIDLAREHLEAEDVTFFGDTFPSGEYWRLYENFRDRACFFDIETTGLSADRDRVTTVSFHQGGDTTTLVAGDDLTDDALRSQFDDADLLVSFNGLRFDQPFLEQNFDVSLDRPHVDLMYSCRKLDLTGGLKSIEKAIGIERDRPDISGRDAVRLWYKYERGDDDDALETLISYNREDVVHLETLMDTVVARFDEELFGVALPEGR